MRVIAISGKAGSGKDYTANILKEYLEKKGFKVLITHYADLLKYLCKQLYGWDGNKDEKGRHLLQYVGTEIVRTKRPDFWVEFMIDILQLFGSDWDYVLIPDCRFPNEINGLIPHFLTVPVRIERTDGYDAGLTEEAKNHPSETSLDSYDAFVWYLKNCGTPNYHEKISDFADYLGNATTSEINDLLFGGRFSANLYEPVENIARRHALQLLLKWAPLFLSELEKELDPSVTFTTTPTTYCKGTIIINCARGKLEVTVSEEDNPPVRIASLSNPSLQNHFSNDVLISAAAVFASESNIIADAVKAAKNIKDARNVRIENANKAIVRFINQQWSTH